MVDVSADFRLHNPAVYEETYGDHGAPELLADAVYGLPELHRDEVRGARLVANPGCYRPQPSSRSHLSPRRGWRRTWSSAPRRGSPAPGGSRETVSTSSRWTRTSRRTESRATATYRRSIQELGAIGAGRVTFVPHLVPLDQGLLASCFVTTSRDLEAEELRRLYAERYEGEPFVEVVDGPPGVRDVRDTNLCRIHVAVDERTGRAMAFAAIDNLWKGAAGQAIQNLNLMLGFEETDGLR